MTYKINLHNKSKWVVAIVTTVCFFVCFPSDISAQKRKPQTSAEAKKQQEAAQKEIKLTEQQIRENEANVKRGLSELGKLEQSISSTNAKISELNTKIKGLKKEISTLESGISSNEKDLENLRSEYLKAVKKMRITKKSKSTLAFLFSSKSVNQAMRRMRYLREFSAWRERQTEEINSKIAELKIQKNALTKAQKEEASALSLQQNSVKQLASQHERQQQIVNDLKSNGIALQAHLKKKHAEAKELGNMVSLLIAEEQRKREEEETKRRVAEEETRKKALAEELRKKEEEKKRQESLAQNQISQSSKSDNPGTQSAINTNANKTKNDKNNTSTDFANARKRVPRGLSSESVNSNDKETAPQASDFASQKGKLSYPTSGSFNITSSFGRQTMTDLPDVEFDNPGIDAETDAGATARAVFKGKVAGVYLLPGYNTVVIVNHGNYYTVYGNISSSSVKTGDSVEAGTNLGKLTLDEENPNHASIHFEVWKNREKLNPQDWLR